MSPYPSWCPGPQEVGLISDPREVGHSSNTQSPEDFSRYKDVDLDLFPIGQ